MSNSEAVEGLREGTVAIDGNCYTSFSVRMNALVWRDRSRIVFGMCLVRISAGTSAILNEIGLNFYESPQVKILG
jgi:hypothetical protein